MCGLGIGLGRARLDRASGGVRGFLTIEGGRGDDRYRETDDVHPYDELRKAQPVPHRNGSRRNRRRSWLGVCLAQSSPTVAVRKINASFCPANAQI